MSIDSSMVLSMVSFDSYMVFSMVSFDSSMFSFWCPSTALWLFSVVSFFGHGGDTAVWLFKGIDRCLYTDTQLKQVTLIEVSSWGQKNLLKKNHGAQVGYTVNTYFLHQY